MIQTEIWVLLWVGHWGCSFRVLLLKQNSPEQNMVDNFKKFFVPMKQPEQTTKNYNQVQKLSKRYCHISTKVDIAVISRYLPIFPWCQNIRLCFLSLKHVGASIALNFQTQMYGNSEKKFVEHSYLTNFTKPYGPLCLWPYLRTNFIINIRNLCGQLAKFSSPSHLFCPEEPMAH